MEYLKTYVEAFSKLHTAVVKGHKAPHKAVLLLAIIDLIEQKRILRPRIELSQTLCEHFEEVWYHYLGCSAIFTPDIAKPYFHMQHEPFWKLVTKEQDEQLMVAEDEWFISKGNDKQDLPAGSYSIKAMRNAFAYAQIDNRLFQLLQNPDARAMLRVILINTYLTNQPTKSMIDIDLKGIMTLALPVLLIVA